MMPPISRPISTSGSLMRNTVAALPSLASSSVSSIWNAANSTSAASAAEPIA